MCGRYVQRTPLQHVMELFSAVPSDDGMKWVARFNIAPTHDIPVIRIDNVDKRTITMLRWGLIPSWAKDPAIGNRMINARVETVAEKPAYRRAVQQRRCLIPADGFYEWRSEGNQKQPYYFHRPDNQPIAFAGLWEHWQQDDTVIDSCTILTTSAEGVVRPVHERMPLILNRSDHARWLDTKTPEPLFPQQFKVDGNLLATRVNTWVNSTRNDDPRCVEAEGPDGSVSI